MRETSIIWASTLCYIAFPHSGVNKGKCEPVVAGGQLTSCGWMACVVIQLEWPQLKCVYVVCMSALVDDVMWPVPFSAVRRT